MWERNVGAQICQESGEAQQQRSALVLHAKHRRHSFASDENSAKSHAFAQYGNQRSREVRTSFRGKKAVLIFLPSDYNIISGYFTLKIFQTIVLTPRH